MSVLVLNLSNSETVNYATLRASLRADAVRLAVKRNQRFAKIVGIDGRTLDVVEAR
jgi:hypothetical protein